MKPFRERVGKYVKRFKTSEEKLAFGLGMRFLLDDIKRRPLSDFKKRKEVKHGKNNRT